MTGPTVSAGHLWRRCAALRILGALACAAVLSACVGHPHEITPDGTAAIATATQICKWADTGHMHAELKDGKLWHVWDEEGLHDAYVNRYDSDGTFVCVTL